MGDIEAFSKEFVTRVRDALDVDEDGSFWLELKHMEANGFDLAWIQPSIRGAILRSYDSPLFDKSDELPHSAERQLVLQLRDRLRNELSLPPLSDHERHDWAYYRLDWKFPSFTGSHEQYKVAEGLSPDEIELVVEHIKRTAPHIMRYLHSVLTHNEPLLRERNPYDAPVVVSTWLSPYIRDQICRLINPHGLVNTLDGEIEITRRLWGEAR